MVSRLIYSTRLLAAAIAFFPSPFFLLFYLRPFFPSIQPSPYSTTDFDILRSSKLIYTLFLLVSLSSGLRRSP